MFELLEKTFPVKCTTLHCKGRCSDSIKSLACSQYNLFTRSVNRYGERDFHLYWDFERNPGVNPLLLRTNMKKYWFKCPINPCGCHRYQCTILSFCNKRTRCPYCSGHKICQHNSAWIAVPNLFLYWDFEKNTIDPKHIAQGSTSKIWWRPFIAGESKRIMLRDIKNIKRKMTFELAWDFSMNVIDPMDRKKGERYWFRCLKNDDHLYFITFNEFFANFDCIGCRKKVFLEVIDHEVPTATLLTFL